jgi:hypothetical protein
MRRPMAAVNFDNYATKEVDLFRARAFHYATVEKQS